MAAHIWAYTVLHVTEGHFKKLEIAFRAQFLDVGLIIIMHVDVIIILCMPMCHGHA